MKKNIIIILLLSFSHFSYGQYIGSTEMDDLIVKPWIPKTINEYAGLYHFGESESESTLKIFYTDSLIVAQISSGYSEEETGVWKSKYENLSNVKINKNGEFKCDQYSGQFITYTDSPSYNKGLKIDNPWFTFIPKGKYEIGYRLNRKINYNYSGIYPQTSYRILNKTDIDSLSKWELQIMRNEVFARYGFVFKEGGKMEKYFKKQNWFQPQHDVVTNFLTQVELKNIELIKKIEKKRNAKSTEAE